MCVCKDNTKMSKNNFNSTKNTANMLFIDMITFVGFVS